MRNLDNPNRAIVMQFYHVPETDARIQCKYNGYKRQKIKMIFTQLRTRFQHFIWSEGKLRKWSLQKFSCKK